MPQLSGKRWQAWRLPAPSSKLAGLEAGQTWTVLQVCHVYAICSRKVARVASNCTVNVHHSVANHIMAI